MQVGALSCRRRPAPARLGEVVNPGSHSQEERLATHKDVCGKWGVEKQDTVRSLDWTPLYKSYIGHLTYYHGRG